MGAGMDRNALLHKINEASFAMDEARLFLDTHPKCEEALVYYRNMCAVREQMVKEYTACYGPLSSYDCFCDDCWKWVEYPWPWEGECK